MNTLKKLLLVGAFLASAQSFAASYGTAGCGLGSMIFHDQPGIVQIFAATTNGIAGNQTFGITSGTSNCEGGGKSAPVFIEANKASLSNDIARGGGETLSALLSIYQCSSSADTATGLKAKYSHIFANTEAELIDSRIRAILKESNSCGNDLV